ncbi:MAG: radical SAM protein [Gammaproteobacteria bacterium]|nr:radical SAM protein [Gammaproteobacteria bacterium]
MATARRIMQEQDLWSPNQQMGLRWPIGCVALEITQRCNLDCTLCYLSEYSEAVHDIPLQEVFKRIDLVHRYYGDNTDIQVTGGDPTLRDRDELVAIIRYIRGKNMRSTLMTNGIRATRSLLRELVCAGLNDVAFHVDTTQQRKGFKTENDLNRIRQEYIRRARGLGLSVIFNTTIHRDNFGELPGLVAFFLRHARYIRTVSFQLQADTGRGVAGKRDEIITIDTVWDAIEKSAGTAINPRAIRTGHPRCNRYGMVAVSNNRAFNLFDDEIFTGRMQQATKDIVADRNRPFRTIGQVMRWSVSNPGNMLTIGYWIGKQVRMMARDLILDRGRVTTLSFFVHNFMDACNLDQDRINACVFKNMTPEGPVSMCEYNARRDDYILQPVPVKKENVIRFWNPLDKQYSHKPVPITDRSKIRLEKKRLKGRARLNAG